MADHVIRLSDHEERLSPADYRQPESLAEAHALLGLVAEAQDASGCRISERTLWRGYRLWWIYYRKIFEDYCLTYSRYRPLFERLEGARKVVADLDNRRLTTLVAAYCAERSIEFEDRRRPHLRLLALAKIAIKLLLSLLSLPVFVATRRRYIVYSSNNFSASGRFDFRLHRVFEELHRRRVPYGLLIRTTHPPAKVLKHFVLRGRPVIFGDAVVGLFRWIDDVRTIFDSARGSTVEGRSMAASLAERVDSGLWASRAAIVVLTIIFRLIGVRRALIVNNSERTLHELIAARMAGVYTIGIMNGVDTRYYHVHKFMEHAPRRDPSLGQDVFGVWSEGWRTYFDKFSKVLYGPALEVAGHLRYVEGAMGRGKKVVASERLAAGGRGGGPIGVLWITEPLLPLDQALPYLQRLIDDARFRVILKVRPSAHSKDIPDTFFDALRAQRPDVLERCRVLDDSIEAALSGADIVVGTHTTALLDALAHGVPVASFRTRKFGDYFDLETLVGCRSLIANGPEDLPRVICQADLEAAERMCRFYLGDQIGDGAVWLVDRLTGTADSGEHTAGSRRA